MICALLHKELASSQRGLLPRIQEKNNFSRQHTGIVDALCTMARRYSAGRDVADAEDGATRRTSGKLLSKRRDGIRVVDGDRTTGVKYGKGACLRAKWVERSQVAVRGKDREALVVVRGADEARVRGRVGRHCEKLVKVSCKEDNMRMV